MEQAPIEAPTPTLLKLWLVKPSGSQVRLVNFIQSLTGIATEFVNLELSQDHEILFIGCMKKEKPTVIAVDARQMTFLSYFTIKKKDFGNKFRIRRMPLNDIILVCGVHHIEIISFNKDNRTFEMYHFFKNIHSGLITDAVFAGDNIYSVGSESDFVHQIKMRNRESYARDVASIMDEWVQ
jgi:hypothetical protein